MSTGMSFDEVGEQFDLPRLKAMQKYWGCNPPVHISVARYMGIAPEEPRHEEINNDGLIEALASFTGG